MLLRATHHTHFEYPRPAVDSHNEVRLEPSNDAWQTLRDFRLTVRPDAKAFRYEVSGGAVHHFNLRGPHDELDVVAESLVETHCSNPYKDLNLLLEDWGIYRDEEFARSYIEYLSPTPYIPTNPECLTIAQDVRKDAGQGVATFLIELGYAINSMLSYDSDATHVHSTIDEVIAGRAGVCQDFAHLMIGCCRAVGVPARYVSGYLFVNRNEVGLRGDHATHAWIEALLPNGRWLGIDPTNRLLANDRYIKIHVGRDYSEVAPTRGIYRGAPAKSLTVSVAVVSA
ncbi:MAG: transglutaminase family protein [Fimbriimonas sp.]